jgi:hypothetical protein
MSIWNRVALGLVFLAAVAMFVFGARALKIHAVWGSHMAALRVQLKSYSEQNDNLLNSEDKDKPGILAMRRQLQQVLAGRGRVWYNCEPQIGPETLRSGKMTVTTDLPVPNGIADKSTLYAIEETEVQKGGRYLGEFHVDGVDEKNKRITLAPNLTFSEEQLKRVAASKGPWTLYEHMPVDRHDVFAELTDAEKKALMPAGTVNEYNRDGQSPLGNDPEDRIFKTAEGSKVYVRRLRDYKQLLDGYHLKHAVFVDQFLTLSNDTKYLEDALADVRQQVQFCQKEVDGLKAEYATATKERDAVLAHQRVLQGKVQVFESAVADMIKSNLAVAGEIARIQLDAARRIDARMRTMAQAGARTN